MNATAVHGDGDGTTALQRSAPSSVCVIGAGAAGLAAGRCLRDEGCRVTVLEKYHDVGGVWRYKPEPEARAPMYRSLVTNLPKETMSYFGFPFPEETQSFTTHAQVLDYLCSYADEHDLHPLISLGCSVESVRLANLPFVRDSSHASGSVDGSLSSGEDSSEEAATGTGTAAAAGRHGGGIDQGQSNAGVENTTLGRWEVMYRRRSAPAAAAVADDDDQVVAEVFDAMCFFSGHFDETHTPTVEGQDEFQGTVMHAREYDIPGVEAFVGKRVLCVGAGSSGTDVAREVSSVTHAVHVCDRSNPVTSKGGERGNVWWRTALEKFESTNGVRFKNGELLESVAPFPLFELQANAVAAAIVGQASFPSLAERESGSGGRKTGSERAGWALPRPALTCSGIGSGSTFGVSCGSLRGRGSWDEGPPSKTTPSRVVVVPVTRVVPSRRLLARRRRRGAAAATEGGAQQRQQLELEGLLNVLSVREVIYNDVGDSRPGFPGGPDDYRRRQYRVDWDSGRFSVSYADRKANGEGPSSPAAL